MNATTGSQNSSKADTHPDDSSLVRSLAWVYAALFIFVVALGYIPGLTNSQGQLLGLFRIELKDDVLHLGSGVWAALAAWYSTRASVFYFRTFGTIYFLDGVTGLLFGNGFLDGGILLSGPAQLDFATRFAANMPHLILGGTAMYIGFVLGRRAPSYV